MSNPTRLFTKYMRKLAPGGFMLDNNGQLVDTSNLTVPNVTAPGTNLKAQALDFSGAPKAQGNAPKPPTGPQPNYSAMAGAGAAIGTSLIDATNSPNEFGHQSVGSTVGKGALSGAALGTSILPGWGTAVGAVVGAGVGLINGEKNKHSDMTMRSQMQQRQDAAQQSYSRSVLANDPGKEVGYQGVDMFPDGGVMGDPKKNILTQSTVGQNSFVDPQGSLSRRPTNLLDNVNYSLTHNGGRDKNASVQMDPTESQLMTDAYIWSKRPDMQGKSPQAIIESYFGRPVHTGNPVDSLRASLNNINHGAVSDFNMTPNISVTDPKNIGMAGLAKGGWIKGAVNPAHKGYCTPMTKSTCTGHRRAFALTMKKHHGFHHKGAGGLMKYAYGGTIDDQTSEKNPLTEMATEGGNAKKLSRDNTLIVGPSHEQGGVTIPELGSELEGGETTKDNFVYSKRLGFAQQHKPIAIAKGKIELKPQTKERINSLKRLNDRESELAVQQETLKKLLGI